jgi:membrane protein implicated in regulation of membrane protease activity
MTIRPRVYVAFFGGAMALAALYCGILYGSADAWRLSITLVPPLVVFVWWMADRRALEQRIKRLEARSEIADERRVTAQTNLTEIEHKLHEIEGRVVDVENLLSLADGALGKLTSHELADATGHNPLDPVDGTVIVRLPVNPL